uniref:SMB domain-containing protein n=1 Tax=Globodera pallida TaxID=36090 RepID=A0A183BMZ0_GLOPA
MLGWCRLLLLCGIVINLGIDEAISAASAVNGSNASGGNGGNGSNASDVNDSTVEDMNSFIALKLNGSTVEDENVVAKRGRQKRQSHLKAFPVLFASALVKAVAITWGKRVVNTLADRFLGGELSDYKKFASDYACSAKCDCGWGNCVPFSEATPGDSCCATNYTLNCCQKCDHFRMAFYGKRNYYDDDTLIVQPSFFVENREGCPMCGWELCIVMTTRIDEIF